MKRGIAFMLTAWFAATAVQAGMLVGVPTFHCISLYWDPPEGAAGVECTVSYGISGQAMKAGHPLWFDPHMDESRYKGSIVGLEPGQSYDIVLALAGTMVQETLSVTTWSETFPVDSQQPLPLPVFSNATLTITASN